MAGFDFYEKYASDTEPLLRALLRKLQRVCRAYELEVHFTHERRSERYYVTVDGPLPMMQASAMALATVLPAFADGYNTPSDGRRRSRLAGRLTRNYWRHVLRMGEMVFDVTDRVGGVPTSFVFDTDHHDDDLNDRMWSLSRTLIAYENGEVGPAQIVEEVHTGLEWLLQRALGNSRAKRMTYAQMLQAMRDCSVIDPPTYEAALRMKDIRRDAKHRGKAAGRESVNEVLPASLAACHRLLAYIAPNEQGREPW